jgi:hypothetical protein
LLSKKNCGIPYSFLPSLFGNAGSNEENNYLIIIVQNYYATG